jgi:hypothetical protein
MRIERATVRDMKTGLFARPGRAQVALGTSPDQRCCRLTIEKRRSAMAQAVTRCRLTGHYMFMGLEVDPKELARSSGPFERKFCPFCACDHLWPQGRLQIPGAEVAVASRHSASGAE